VREGERERERERDKRHFWTPLLIYATNAGRLPRESPEEPRE